MNNYSVRSSAFFSSILVACALAACTKHEEVGASTSLSSSASPADAKAAPASESVAPAHPAIDAGALLSDEEIQTIVGAPLKDRKLSERADRGLAVSQCYFELPTASDSMVLSVWEGAGPDDTRAKSVWKEMFERDFDKEEEGEKEEKENKRPEKIADLGEQAYALPQRFGALIYVLKGGNFFRLSIGGGPSDTKEKKLEILRAVSEAVLKRMP